MLRAICGIRCLGRAPSTGYQKYRRKCISTSSPHRDVSRPSNNSNSVAKPAIELASGPEKEDSDATLLARAQAYGITTTQQLDQECLSILSGKKHPDQVETKSFRSDLKFWKLLLDYGARTHGIKGAKSVWQGLKCTPGIDLNSESDLATAIWLKILNAAVQSKDLTFFDLLLERDSIVLKRPRLLTETVVALLRERLELDAVLMCYHLQEIYKDGEYDIFDLFMAYQPKGQSEFRRFFLIYDHVRPEKMYGKAIRYLWQEKRADDAFVLHKFLVSKGDFPDSFLDLEPFVVHLAKTDQDPGAFIRQLAASGAGYTAQARAVYELERQRQTVDEGNTVGLGAYTSKRSLNGVSDSVAAKAFAARGLSFEFVLNSLRAFGLTEIGPQSIREIGIAAGALDMFARRLAILDHYEIDTGGSAYSRIVRKLCTAKEHALLKQVLQTDMHHDVFEDTMLQRRLLVDKVHKCKWPEVNLLLTMLNNGDVGSLKSHVTVALLAPLATDKLAQRTLLGASAQNPIFRGFEDRQSHIWVIDRMFRDFVPVRPQHRRQPQRLARTRFVVGYMQECAATGASFPYFHWRHVLLQLGANRSLREVFSLILWIANRVMSRHGTPPIVLSGDPPAQVLNTLFDSRFQTALMHWSLKTLSRHTLPKANHDWKKCLHLLRILAERYHVIVNLPTLRRVVVLRCAHLRRSGTRSRFRTQVFSTRANAYRTCNEILRCMHDLWSTSPAVRQVEFHIAHRSLNLRHNRRQQRSFHLTRSTGSKKLLSGEKRQRTLET